MEERELTNHLIDEYRLLVAQRYEYRGLKERFELSSKITEDVINSLREYFLSSIYPPSEEREMLEVAFESLKTYISHPAKTMFLIGNMTSAIVKFGFQFPKALKAGMITLESYLQAKNFENKLVKAAVDMGYSAPISPEELEVCINHIPRKDSEEFIQDIIQLFESITDIKLLRKTISILDDVRKKMESHPKVYSKEEVDGILLGMGILINGYELLKDYDSSVKREIVQTIEKNELWFLETVYR